MKEGVSKGKSIEDIARHHNVPTDAIRRQAKMGVKVEKEHTDSSVKALRIALDHLTEDPKYYTKLKSLNL